MIKNLLSSILLGVYFCASFAQNNKPVISDYSLNPLEMNIKIPSPTSPLGTIDTIDDYLLRASALVIVSAQGGGYVFGTGWQDFGPPLGVQKLTAECGNHYSGIGNANVTEVLTFFAATVIMGNADSITANVYVAGSDSMPATLAGSAKISTSDIVVQTITSIPISGTANVTGDFFVSIAYSGIDDTVGIVSSNPATNDGQGEKRTRIKLAATPQWLTADQAFGGFDADVMIIPVVDIQSGIGNIQINDINIGGAFPNPAGEETQIRLTLNSKQSVTVNVFDINGKIVFYSGVRELSEGERNIKINTSGYSEGTYYYTIDSGKQSVTSKFSVIK